MSAHRLLAIVLATLLTFVSGAPLAQAVSKKKDERRHHWHDRDHGRHFSRHHGRHGRHRHGKHWRDRRHGKHGKHGKHWKHD
jgi:hypothetical protein